MSQYFNRRKRCVFLKSNSVSNALLQGHYFPLQDGGDLDNGTMPATCCFVGPRAAFMGFANYCEER